MRFDALAEAIEALRGENRLRCPDDELEREQLRRGAHVDFLDAASNDYLSLARTSAAVGYENVPSETRRSSGLDSDVSRGTFAPGGAASRLVYGTSSGHLQLEREVAEWAGMPSALLFSSGYAANLGALGALLSPEDAVFSDSLNHASLIDGIRLSRARPTIFPHLDLAALEAGLRSASGAAARWVVVESYYSMDGDGPDLRKLAGLCKRHDACLYIDEAHGLGVFGVQGAGRCQEAGVTPDVLMLGFGKGVGSEGACVAGSQTLRTWLWNRARSFVFSTAPSPLRVQSLRTQVARARAADDARARLDQICHRVRTGLVEAGVSLSKGGFGPIVSLIVGGEEEALEFCSRLKAQGILTQAIRPPTVAEGACRLRLVLHSDWTEAQVARFILVVSRETRT